MEIIRLTAFLVATTYLPGRALRVFAPRTHPVIFTAYGLSLSLVLCALPVVLAGVAMLVVALGSLVTLALTRSRAGSKTTLGAARLAPGILVALVCLSLGPWGDASPPSADRGLGLVYRTGKAVGNRSAGPRPVATEAALIHARGARAGDPFVSGQPLRRLDPRRTYWSVAERVSGVSPYVLIGKVEPALAIVGVIAAALVAYPAGSWLAPLLLFGSGLSFVFALVPAIRSWPFRIWVYLSESTGLADLLTDPMIALTLFLLLAAMASTSRALALLAGAAIVSCDRGMALPAAVAALVFAWRVRFGLITRWPLIAVVVVGFAVSKPTPLAPMLRALEYARLDTLATVVSSPFASPIDMLRTAIGVSLFVVLSLGVRVFAAPAILSDVRSREDDVARRLGCFIVALLVCGMAGVGTERAWSLALLLMWLPLAAMVMTKARDLAAGQAFVWWVGLAALAMPASVNYMLHYRDADTHTVSPSEVALAEALRERSQVSDAVLHRPNRRSLSPASHLGFRPSVLCYYGRAGDYDEAELDARSEAVRRFFETADEAAGRAIVEEYDVRWVIVEKRRPLRFAMPRWLVETAESETSILYEVN